MHRLTLLLLLLTLNQHAQDSLSGNIGGMTFEPSGNPYIVKDNITIQEGKTTKIKAGCVFLFRPFTGIMINGGLTVEGTTQSPVIFTSSSDEKHASNVKTPAAPFDWNGIFISPHAGDVSFSNIELAYSTYGIKSQKDGIVLKNALFNANGQYSFTIHEKMQEVTLGVPFNYEKMADEKTEDIPKPGKSDNPSNMLPLILGATGIVAGVAAIVTFVKTGEANREYKNEIDPAKQKELEKKFNGNRTAGIACAGVSAICLPISAMLFIKNKRQVKKTVSIYFINPIDHEMELGMTMRF